VILRALSLPVGGVAEQHRRRRAEQEELALRRIRRRRTESRRDLQPDRTCKLNDVEPEAHLRHVIGVIADQPINRVAELLPWNLRDRLASDSPSVT
jgi:hypothetical protein